MGGGNWARFGQEVEQLLLPGDARLQNEFFWVLALTAVQVRWVNVEINFYLVLDLDGPYSNSDWLDAEGGLLEFSLALVMHRVARHFEYQFFAHAVQHERTHHAEMAWARLFHTRRVEVDFRKSRGVQHSGAQHGALDFGAVFL